MTLKQVKSIFGAPPSSCVVQTETFLPQNSSLLIWSRTSLKRVGKVNRKNTPADGARHPEIFDLIFNVGNLVIMHTNAFVYCLIHYVLCLNAQHLQKKRNTGEKNNGKIQSVPMYGVTIKTLIGLGQLLSAQQVNVKILIPLLIPRDVLDLVFIPPLLHVWYYLRPLIQTSKRRSRIAKRWCVFTKHIGFYSLSRYWPPPTEALLEVFTHYGSPYPLHSATSDLAYTVLQVVHPKRVHR